MRRWIIPLAGGLIGAACGFAATYLGLGWLQGDDQNGSSRAAVAAGVSVMFALASALIVRAGAEASEATAEWDLAEIEELRRRVRRTRWAIVLGGMVAIGASIASYVLTGVVYEQLNAGLESWHPDRRELGMGELVVSLALGLLTGVIAQRVLRPDPFADAIHRSDKPEHELRADDAEIARIAQRVRAVQRRNGLAQLAAVLVFGVACAGVWWALTALAIEFGAFELLLGGGAAAVTSALVHRVLRSPISVADVVDGTDEARPVATRAPTESAPTYASALASAEALTVHRKTDLAAYLGLAPSSYVVLGGSDLVCDARRIAIGWQRFVPARWRSFQAALMDDERTVATIDAGLLGLSLTVRGEDGTLLGVVESPIFGRRYRVRPADGRPYELRGALIFRRVFRALRDGEVVGRLEKRPGWRGILALLFGIEHAIEADLPRDATLPERTMLLAGLLWIDQRHF